jgi:hypothetical protein
MRQDERISVESTHDELLEQDGHNRWPWSGEIR